MQKWEYRIVNPNIDAWSDPAIQASQLEALLNQLGAEGWELISGVELLMFKRPY